jgi:hypothetical protein
MSEQLIKKIRQYIPKGDGYNSEFANDLEQSADLIDKQAKEIDRLRTVLGAYANVYNWNEDYQGIRRVWLEPGSSTPETYNGFEMARAAILNDKDGKASA